MEAVLLLPRAPPQPQFQILAMVKKGPEVALGCQKTSKIQVMMGLGWSRVQGCI